MPIHIPTIHEEIERQNHALDGVVSHAKDQSTPAEQAIMQLLLSIHHRQGNAILLALQTRS